MTNIQSGKPPTKTKNIGKNMLIKSLYLFLLTGMLNLIGLTTNAQSNISIGSGTSKSIYYPNYYLYDYSYTQTVYSAAELIAGGGISTGMITKVYYKPTSVAPTEKWRDWVIYMGNTSQDGFNSIGDVIPVGNLTQVFSDTIINTTIANSWIEITLSTPFLWDGSSNIVVAIDENTPSYGNSPNWAGFTATLISGSLNRGVYFYQDGTNILPSAPSAGFSGVSNSIAQIQFMWTAAAPCSGTPVAGTVSGPLGALCSGSPFSLSLSGFTLA
ncbi:MAG TPA: hypothetical protein VLZ83_14485, partial [Edaphocola sp.]|nr:hypothetical protein [Edaphocola sp.]